MTAENPQIEKLFKYKEKLGAVLVKKLTDQYVIFFFFLPFFFYFFFSS